MTDLTRPITRRSLSSRNGRRIVVTLGPGDVIGFRLERTRTTYYTTISACHDLAVRQAVAARRKAK